MIFQFNGLFGQDSYEYVKIEKGLQQKVADNSTIPYSVFPIGYALAGAVISPLFGNNIFPLQFISMISLCICCIYLRKIFRLIYDTDILSELFLLLFFVLSPYVLRFSLLVMSDMFCISIFLMFLYHTFLFRRSPSLKQLILLSIAGAACIFIRYASIVALVIPVIIIVADIVRIKKYILLFIPVLILILIALPDLLLRNRLFLWDLSGGKADLAYFYVPEQWKLSNMFRHEFSNLDGVQHYSYPNILFALQNFLHPAFIFTGLIFIIASKPGRNGYKKEVVILAAIILLYALFAAGYPYQSNRYLLFTFPLILILYYPVFVRLYQWCKIPKWAKTAGILCCAALQLFLFTYSSRTIYAMNKNEKDIAETIRDVFPGKNIYTFSIDGALNTYGTDYMFYDIYTFQYDSVQPNSLLLFNYNLFAEQFAALNPMKNYTMIKNNYKLDTVRQFSNGWTLYAIE